MNFLVTGGAGFIGSHFADLAIESGHKVVIIDKLTYAGSLKNVHKDAVFIQGDICDQRTTLRALKQYDIDAIFNFAAESHVDRSIKDATAFIRTNIVGTYRLLRCALRQQKKKPNFKFIQISTDEVFGDLGPGDTPFTEKSPFKPNSPYAASKASADFIVGSFHHTFGLQAITTHCSNNYGPRQYPEKLMPLAIKTFLSGGAFGLHGDGSNTRDWIHVSDHIRGIYMAWMDGVVGERYLFGGDCEMSNYDIVHMLNSKIDKGLVTYIKDRPGNDRRYAVNSLKAKTHLGWTPTTPLEWGISNTISWYQDNQI